MDDFESKVYEALKGVDLWPNDESDLYPEQRLKAIVEAHRDELDNTIQRIEKVVDRAWKKNADIPQIAELGKEVFDITNATRIKEEEK